MSAVDDVKQKIDIVDVIGQYVQLKKVGRNFKALCPFHNEKTPSFIVFPDQGTWHCFGACGTGGDVFTFLMRRENIDFSEALRRLASRAGVELVRESPGENQERKRLREILAAAAAHYHYLLKNHPAAQFARDYTARRFISPEMIEQFELGFALNDWEAMKSFLVGKGYAIHDLEAAGLVIKSEHEQGGYYDRFRGRLMFPIRNRSGEVTGFGARALDDAEPKYLNSPQTALFDKSATLYGLELAKDAIREQNLAIIVEGYMDVIGAHQAGFKNVVASLGTALTEKQLGLLKRLTQRYALALDPDAAGEEATKRGLEIAREALTRKTIPVPMGAGLIGFEERLEAELLVIPMPHGQDPDEIIHDDPARWRELVDHAEPLVDFYFRVMTRDLDLKAPRGKTIAVRRLMPIIREIGDGVQRAHYTQQLARLVQVSEQTIMQEIAQHPPRRAARGIKPPIADPATSSRVEGTVDPALRTNSKLDEYCLTLALHTPEHLPRIDFLEAEDFSEADSRALFIALREFALQAELFDREAFRESLDDALKTRCDDLLARAAQLPNLNEPDLAREIEIAAYRLRQSHDKAELTDLEFLIREQDSERDSDEKRMLHERAELLRKRIATNQKALSARSVIRTRAVSIAGLY